MCLGTEDRRRCPGAQVRLKPTKFMLMLWIEQMIDPGLDHWGLSAPSTSATIDFNVPIEVLSSRGV